MRTVLVITIFVLGVFVTTSSSFALSTQLVPLITERITGDDVRDPDQSENEIDLADLSNESSAASTKQTSDQ